MHDEAAPGFADMIDQTSLGHRLLLAQFNVTPRASWQIDPFGARGGAWGGATRCGGTDVVRTDA